LTTGAFVVGNDVFPSTADPHDELALVKRSASGDTQMHRQKNNPGCADRFARGTIALGTATLALLLFLPGLATADPTARCDVNMLKGKYVFTATGFTRAPNSPPGTPWVPKGILEVLDFHGDGTLETPRVTVANAFGDTGGILQPVPGSSGEYSINDDCTGTVHFFDAANITFTIHVEPPRGDTIRMIQTNPPNNVFVGIGNRTY
jgi:hypothetical protein